MARDSNVRALRNQAVGFQLVEVVEVVNAHHLLQPTRGLGSEAMRDEMNFSKFVPAPRDPVGKSQNLLARVTPSDLSQVARLVQFLVGVFLQRVLRPVDSPDQVGPVVVLAQTSSFSYFVNPHYLLVKFASSVVGTLDRSQESDVDVLVVAVSHHFFLQGVGEVVAQ